MLNPTARAAGRRAGLVLAAVVAIVAAAGCSDTPKDNHPDQLVSKRQALFKQFTRTLEPMGVVARERQPYQADALLAQALALQQLAPQPWPFFRADGNYPPTRALPKVWDDAAAFEQAQQNYLARVDALVEAAKGRELATVRPAVLQVEQACKACHDQFRRP